MDTETAVRWLGSLVNRAAVTETPFSDCIKMYEAGGEQHRLQAERLTIESVRFLILKVISLEDSFQADPKMMRLLKDWNTPH